MISTEATRRARWQRRPVLNVAVRALALALPIVVGVGMGALVSRLLPAAHGLGEVLWWVAVLGAATVAMLGAEALARRLLPLSLLLQLTMAFPDRAPSRLRIALRATSVRRMHARVVSPSHLERPLAEQTADLIALAAALNAHDRRTRGHSQRVQALTSLVAEQLHLEDDERERLAWAAFLHDIGKLAVPRALLNKPGPPDRREWAVLRRHPAEGARLAEPLRPWLGDAVGAVGEHHEHFDGTGYPNGLTGTDISLAGRIVSVTDAFETITAVRSYKKPAAFEDARAEITRCAGQQFDPHVVRAFLEVSLGRLRWVIGFASFVALVPLVGAIPRARAAMSRPVLSGAGAGALGAALASAVLTGGPAILPAAAPSTADGGRAPMTIDDASAAPGVTPAVVPSASTGSSASRVAAISPALAPSSTPSGPGVDVDVTAGQVAVHAATSGIGVEQTDGTSPPSITVVTPGGTIHAP